MGNIYNEIVRLETAKSDIETAIESCGVNVPDTESIDTYASYIRQIPSAVFSDLNVDPTGGTDQYIQSIEQENGLIKTTVGGLVSTSSSGLVPKADSAVDTINSQVNDWVLTNKNGTIGWYKLPDTTFKNDNTTYSLSGILSGDTFVTTLTPSNGDSTKATIPTMVGASSTSDGWAGLVPTPGKGNEGKFLKGDGTWGLPSETMSSSSLYVGTKDSASNDETLNGNTYLKLFENSTLKYQYNIKGTGNTTVVSDSSGNLIINTTTSWDNVTDKPEAFNPTLHTHTSNQIIALTDYVKAATIDALSTDDSLNTALGKLEYKADVTYNLVNAAYDGDGTIENLSEILKVLEGISDTDTIQAIVGKYLPKSGGIISTTNSYYPIRIKCPASFGQTGIRLEVDDTNMGALVSTVGNTYIYNFANSIGLGIYNGVAKFGDNTLIHSGNIGSQSVNYANRAGSASYASTVGINYSNDSNSTYQMLWGSGNYIYGTGGIYCNPYTDYLYATSFYCGGWFRSSGASGWYNESYGGGIYMEDSTWVRIYNGKQFYVANSSSNAIHSAGGVYVAGCVHAYDNYLKSSCNGCTVTIGSQNNGWCHYDTTAPAHWFNVAVYSAGGFYQYSDETLKNFYDDIKFDFEEIKKLPKKYFKWKEGDDSIYIGTSAQAVQKIYPELVGYKYDGKLSVAYDKLSIIALKGIDELYDLILELKEENQELKNRINYLENK